MLVIPGLASVVAGGRTPLEQAAMPALRSLALAGEVGALQPDARRPADLAQAVGRLLGLGQAGPVGCGAVEVGRALAAEPSTAGWHAARVTDPFGAPAPRLLVARTIERLKRQLPGCEVRGGRRAHDLLLRGELPAELPVLAEVTLSWLPEGVWPELPIGDHTPEVIAPAQSLAIGLAALAGLPRVVLAAQLSDTTLREAAGERLQRAPARLVVVTPSVRPRGLAEEIAHEVMVERLEELDRTLIAPLRELAQWRGAEFIVTSDLPRAADGRAHAGAVPWVRRGMQPGRSTAGGLRREALPYVERVLSSALPVDDPWMPGA